MNLELSARLAGSQLVVACRGQLDVVDAAPAVAAIAALMSVGQLLILDLAALDFIDCFALRALTEMRSRFRLSGGEVLAAAPSVQVRRLLALTGLEAWFCAYLTVAAAIVGAPGVLAGLAEAV